MSSSLYTPFKTLSQIHHRMPSFRVLIVLGIMLTSTAFMGLYLGFQFSPPPNLQRFSSITDLTQYMTTHHPPPLITGLGWDSRWTLTPAMTLADSTGSGTPSTIEGTGGYSTTNVQVVGVDEPDIVKNDGQFIYCIVDEEVIVVDAYPSETAEIKTRFDPEGDLCALFLFNSTKLVVITQSSWTVTIGIYEVSNPEAIFQSHWVKLDGTYYGARMIGHYLYLLAHMYPNSEDGIQLPTITTPNERWNVPAHDIYYDPGSYDMSFHFEILLGLDIIDPEAAPDAETILVGGQTSTIYSSLTNIYLAISRFPILSRSWFDRTTTIHRFQIHDGSVSYQASGLVAGYLINQFALDEAGEYLRVATTSWKKLPQTGLAVRLGNLFQIQTPESNPETWIRVSNVYILDKALNLIGKLEGLAPGEQIYSARFVGNTGYLVTFFKTDPLFIIDLTNPTQPRLMGELVIPGYSDYLHPVTNGLLLGLGKDAVASESESWWWYQGVKISVFNTTDPTQPEEIDKQIIGVRGTESEALQDHKAILVDSDLGLCILPILLREHLDNPDPDPTDYGELVWQAAYIFDINTTSGELTLRGQITHLEDLEAFRMQPYEYQSYFVRRSLYIGEILYTFSESKLMFHSLSDLSSIGELSWN